MSDRKVFEPALLPLAEKERLLSGLLDEFGIKVHTYSRNRNEMIIPCTISTKHKDQHRNPTGALNSEKLTYKCLGCGASGGLLWFIAEHRGTSSTEARDWLGKETGTDGHLMELASLLRYFDALYAGRGHKVPLQTFSDRILEPWALLHPWVTDPIEYDARGRNIGGRGIPEETAERFRVGYAAEYPYSKSQTSERIVIPHFWRGDLVGWQTRRLANDNTAKYKSSIDFPKDTTIYNYAPREHSVALVVESPMSTLRHTHHHHMPATFGKDVTEAQVRLLGRYEKVIFWFDNDPGGWGAYADTVDRKGEVVKPGVLEQVASMTNVWAVENPYHADPADLSDEVVDDIVKTAAVPWVVWRAPEVLLCHRCGSKAHEGGCHGGED